MERAIEDDDQNNAIREAALEICITTCDITVDNIVDI